MGKHFSNYSFLPKGGALIGMLSTLTETCRVNIQSPLAPDNVAVVLHPDDARQSNVLLCWTLSPATCLSSGTGVHTG